MAAVTAGGLLVSGGSEADPRTPAGLPGLAAPFLGTAVVGGGGLTAAVDAYGDVVDLRAPGPTGSALIESSAARQAAGTVAAGTGIVPWVRIGGQLLPTWRADAVTQRYLPGTNVVRTVARFGRAQVAITAAARGQQLAMLVDGRDVRLRVDADLPCQQERRGERLAMTCSIRKPGDGVIRQARQAVAEAVASDRRWLGRKRPLGWRAPAWARRIYCRSLLVLRALTDAPTGAVAAGARDGWAYVWPRDAAAVALAYAASGYRMEARRVARFLLGLDLSAAARFDSDGDPVPGRGPQGDVSGWVSIAARAVELDPPPPLDWRDLPDYQEGTPGDYLGNAIAAADRPKSALSNSKSARRLFRHPGDPSSGLDSAAAWAVRPFELRWLYLRARRTMLALVGGAGRFGITPGTAWQEKDQWSAPTAWTAWSLAALGERRQALGLLRALRRSATPAGTLPERVNARTGLPRSTTPLAWSHAFAILALRELYG
jgi:Glycosyl hydrolases family 15